MKFTRLNANGYGWLLYGVVASGVEPLFLP